MATEKRMMCVDVFKKNLCHYCNTYMSDEPCEPGECWVHDVIAQTDTVDAVEVVHGHWTATDVIFHQAGYGVRYYYHAECKVNPHRLFECENDYCPNCGAKMDGK